MLMAVQQYRWDDPAILEHSRQQLQKELARRLRHFEAVYGLKSAELEAALKTERLTETAEVCDWLITYHTYCAIE